MIRISYSQEFVRALKRLRNIKGKKSIEQQIAKAGRDGCFHNAKCVGKAVFEMRIDIGTGNRIYFSIRGKTCHLLILGDKSSQRSDIERAKRMAHSFRRHAGYDRSKDY